MSRRTAAFAAPALALLLALTGCQSSADEAASPDLGLTITDPWVKAADEGMTAAFGTLVNSTDQDITVVAAQSGVSRMELHEMAAGDDGAMVMRPKEGGFVVPADGSLTLAPGGEHIMFMDLSAPLVPGDEVEVTVVAADDTTVTFTAPVRTFTGAQEDYVGDEGMETPMPSTTP